MKLVAALVRVWAAVYTWGLPEAARQARRDEIESDLWECRYGDPATRSTPFTVLGRLVRGVPDDLGWWWEHASLRLIIAGGAAAIVAIATIWLIVWVGAAQTLPKPMPLEGRASIGFDYGPPPPPPPPPCPPPGLNYPAPTPCAPFR